jgi:hypothetical protein
MCRKKVKQTCPCRRLKKEFPCDVVRAGQFKVECDDVCKQKKDEEMKVFVCFQACASVQVGCYRIMEA